MIDKPFLIPQPIQPVKKPAVTREIKEREIKGKEDSFNQVLQRELLQTQELKFSRHAMERLNARAIKIEKEHLLRLNEAVQRAQAKGSRDTLVMLDDMAFVVSVKNQTVITAVDGESRKENIFTNIDSAVIN